MGVSTEGCTLLGHLHCRVTVRTGVLTMRELLLQVSRRSLFLLADDGYQAVYCDERREIWGGASPQHFRW